MRWAFHPCNVLDGSADSLCIKSHSQNYWTIHRVCATHCPNISARLRVPTVQPFDMGTLNEWNPTTACFSCRDPKISWKSSILTRVNCGHWSNTKVETFPLDFCGYLCRASVHKLLETKKLLFTHLTALADNELFDSHCKSWHVYTLVTSAKYAWIELTNILPYSTTWHNLLKPMDIFSIKTS